MNPDFTITVVFHRETGSLNFLVHAPEGATKFELGCALHALGVEFHKDPTAVIGVPAPAGDEMAS